MNTAAFWMHLGLSFENIPASVLGHRSVYEHLGNHGVLRRGIGQKWKFLEHAFYCRVLYVYVTTHGDRCR